MANVKAIATGNWSAGLAVFSAIPQPGDNIFSNGFTITINQDINVAVLTNVADATSGAVGGGSFACSTNRNITCAITAGNIGTPVLAITGSINVTYTGNSTGGSTTLAYGIQFSSTGTLTWIGNGIGGSAGGPANAMAVNNAGNGNVVHVGNLTGGSNSCAGFSAAAGSWITTGTWTAGGAGEAMRTSPSAFGQTTLNGNSIGSATSTAPGFWGAGSGQTIINGISIAGESLSVNFTHAGVYNTNAAADVRVNASECSTRGIAGTLGFVKYSNTVNPTVKVYRMDGTPVTLANPASLGLLATDLRFGVTVSGINGLLKVATPDNVRKGVPTDNTVGTAEITAADILDAIQISEHPVAKRLKACSTSPLITAAIAAL